MNLAEKMAMMADRAHAVPKALEARADALLPRIDALEKQGHSVFGGLETIMADAEQGVAAGEAAFRKLTNLPLPGSAGSSGGTETKTVMEGAVAPPVPPPWKALDSAPKDKPITLRLPGVADDGLQGSWDGKQWVAGNPPAVVYPSMWKD